MEFITAEDVECYPNKIMELLDEFQNTFPQVDIYNNSIQWKLFLRYVYKNLFAMPDDQTRLYYQHNRIDYKDTVLLDKILDVYCDICYLCKKDINPYDFGLFTGIQYTTILQWQNPTHKNSFVWQRLASGHEYVIRSKLHDTNNPTGQIALANNDLGWSTARVEHTTQERRLLSREELQQLSGSAPILPD